MADCTHHRTRIEPDGNEKLEECVLCGEVVDTHEMDRERYVCGSTDTTDGSPCEVTVSNTDEHCWRHE